MLHKHSYWQAASSGSMLTCTMQRNSLPRGIRNNNPLNIKKGDAWLGRSNRESDEIFCEFAHIRYGYRAAFIILKKYITKYGCDTITKIIDRWAPDGEPYQSNYKKAVCKRTNLDPLARIDYCDRETMVDIVAAMAKVENGIEVDRQYIYEAYDMV